MLGYCGNRPAPFHHTVSTSLIILVCMHKLHPQFHVIPLQCPTCNYGNTLKPEACSTQRALAKTPYTCNTNFGERSLYWTDLWADISGPHRFNIITCIWCTRTTVVLYMQLPWCYLLSSSPLQSLTNERTKWARDVINFGKLLRGWLVNYYQQSQILLFYPWSPDILIKFLT